jgi:hypothetical protein
MKTKSGKALLIDFVAMAENEIQRIKTGYAPGLSMRDCLGQWEATVREAKAAIAAEEKRLADWHNNPDGPQAA